MPIEARQIATIITSIVLFVAPAKLLKAQTESSPPNSSERRYQLRFAQISEAFSEAPERDALELIDLVAKNHWMPPVRQEMIWKGIQFAYQFSGLIPLADTAEEVPDSTNPNELSEFLRVQKERWLSDPDLVEDAREIGFEKLFATGIVESIPGGAEFIAAKQVKVNESLAANRYVGVGIQLSMRERPLVTKVLYGGSGRKAGMLDGDMILEIDDLSTQGQNIAQVVERLRGPEGTAVKMKLKQPTAEPRTIEVVRSVTFIPTVVGWSANDKGEQQFLFPNDHSIAYLRIERIGPSTVHELKQAEKTLRKKQLKGVVLDLRTGGGRLHDAVMVGDLFLDEGVLGYTQYRDRKTKHVSLPGKLFRDTPTIALIGPAMGADRVLLAAAFQDSGEIALAGTAASNPALVRKQFSLPSGASVIFPVGILRRGNGDMLCIPNVAATLSDPRAAALKPDYSLAPILTQQARDPEAFRRALWPTLLKTILAEREKSKTDERS